MINKKHVAVTAVITFIVTFVLVISIVFGGAFVLFSGFSGESSDKLDRIKKLIDTYYIYDYDEEAMNDAALTAYADAVGDPYTVYINKSDFKEMKESTEGNYVGIGVEVYIDTDKLLTVISVFDNSPAAEAGIRSGDKIVAVDGTEVSYSNYNEAINMIRGEATEKSGEKANLTIMRNGERIDMQVARAEVVAITAKEKVIDGNIGYIRISDFGDQTAEEFKGCIERLKSQNVTGVVVDLRNNPGGTLDSVVKVADMLLPKGRIITIKDKLGNEEAYDSDADFYDIPLCVLINGSSASASEALAGAIADHGRGTLIGVKSFGKGIVQSIFELGDGTAFKVTTATYYTPNGTCIHGQGIEPNIKVELDEETANQPITNIPYEKDYQLQKAVEVLKSNK